MAGSNTTSWEVLYAGYRFETATSLFHVRHRVLNAALGTWVQRDPLGLAAGISLYQYAAVSPTNLTDPSGLIYAVAIPVTVILFGVLVIIFVMVAVRFLMNLRRCGWDPNCHCYCENWITGAPAYQGHTHSLICAAIGMNPLLNCWCM